MKEEFDFYDRTSLKSYNLDSSMRYQLACLDSLDVFTRKHCENVAAICVSICICKMDLQFIVLFVHIFTI